MRSAEKWAEHLLLSHGGWDDDDYVVAVEVIARIQREALEEAARLAAPYHTNHSPDGCPVLCSSCRDRRNIRDAIRALVPQDPETRIGAVQDACLPASPDPDTSMTAFVRDEEDRLRAALAEERRKREEVEAERKGTLAHLRAVLPVAEGTTVDPIDDEDVVREARAWARSLLAEETPNDDNKGGER